MPSDAAAGLRVSERLLLFCIASSTDHHHAGITHEIVTSAMVKGLVERDGGGTLAFWPRGRRGRAGCGFMSATTPVRRRGTSLIIAGRRASSGDKFA